MKWRGKTIVDINRDFLDAAGAHHEAKAVIESPTAPSTSPLVKPLDSVAKKITKSATAKAVEGAWLENMKDLAVCSQRGLGERFDGSIGSSTVLFPYGGKYQTLRKHCLNTLNCLVIRRSSLKLKIKSGY